MLKLIDIHCHLAKYQHLLDLRNVDIDGKVIHVSTALNPLENELHLMYDIDYWFAGIHPSSAEFSIGEKLTLLELIPFHDILGLGEIGLDRNFPDLNKQVELLEMQLEQANIYGLPTLYHLVGHEYEFIKIHKKWDLKNMKIMHGFNSSFEVFKELDKLGFYFSIGNRLLNNPKQREVVEAILQTKRFFLESDAPYDGGLDEVVKIAVKLRDNYGIGMDEIKEMENKNFEDLLEENRESLSKK